MICNGYIFTICSIYMLAMFCSVTLPAVGFTDASDNLVWAVGKINQATTKIQQSGYHAYYMVSKHGGG